MRLCLPAAPRSFSASAFDKVCRALGEAVRGHQSARLIAVLGVPTGPGEERNTEFEVMFNARHGRAEPPRELYPDVVDGLREKPAYLPGL